LFALNHQERTWQAELRKMILSIWSLKKFLPVLTAPSAWLGRIELEVVDRSLTTSQRIDAIENILLEYKVRSGRADVGCASA